MPSRATGCSKRPEHAPTDARHPVLVTGAGNQDGELVPTEAGDEPGLPHGGGQSRSDLGEKEVPLLVSEGVVDLLELVQVEDHDRGARRSPRGDVLQGLGQPALQLHPVRQTGQRVVQRVVPQLADELSVAEGHAGMVGDGLEQEQVVLVGRADVAQPVGDEEHADDPAVAAQGHGHGVTHRVPVQERAGRRVAGRLLHEQRFAAEHDLIEQPRVLGAGRLLGPGQPAGGTQPHGQ